MEAPLWFALYLFGALVCLVVVLVPIWEAIRLAVFVRRKWNTTWGDPDKAGWPWGHAPAVVGMIGAVLLEGSRFLQVPTAVQLLLSFAELCMASVFSFPMIHYAMFFGHLKEPRYTRTLQVHHDFTEPLPGTPIALRLGPMGYPRCVWIPADWSRERSWFRGWVKSSEPHQVWIDPSVPSGVDPSASLQILLPWAKAPLHGWDLCHPAAPLFLLGSDVLHTLLIWCGGTLTISDGVLQIPDEWKAPPGFLKSKQNSPFFFEALVDDTWQLVDTGSRWDCLIVHPSEVGNYDTVTIDCAYTYTYSNGRLVHNSCLLTVPKPELTKAEKMVIFPSEWQQRGETTKILGTYSLPTTCTLRQACSPQALSLLEEVQAAAPSPEEGKTK